MNRVLLPHVGGDPYEKSRKGEDMFLMIGLLICLLVYEFWVCFVCISRVSVMKALCLNLL